MIWLYRLIMNLAIPIGLIGLAIRGLRNRQYWHRWPERFGVVPPRVKKHAPFDLWIHAVSVGEARAVTPLVNHLLNERPDFNILLTTTTPTGSNMVKMLLADRVQHCYFPYDVGWAMRCFVAAAPAKVTLIMETEIWPNMIRAVTNTKRTLVYTNVRLSKRSYSRYAKLPHFVKDTLNRVDHFAAQGETDQKHLISLGVAANKISITGSMKFDINVPQSLRETAEVLHRQLGQDRLIWIAGSTHEGEESIILAAFKTLKTQFPSLLLILVPRHPERFDYMARKIQRRNLVCVRRTQGAQDISADVDVYLGDTMGDLSLLYACSDVAFVGGSLVPLGGQNILEPCALGVPVVFGPHTFNFPDISNWTTKENAGQVVKDKKMLVDVLSEWLANPSLRDEIGNNGLRFIAAHTGALDKNQQLIQRLVDDN